MATIDSSRPVTGYPPPPQQLPHNNPNGYPYTNPYPYPNPSYGYPDPQTARRTIFRRRLLASLLAFFIIVGCIVFIIWLVLRPRLPQFRLDSLSVSNFNVSAPSQTLTATWAIGLSVYNPNKKLSISYYESEASVFYKSEFISQTPVPPLSQGTKTRSSFNVTVSAVGSYVDNWVVKDVNEDRGRSMINFNVKIVSLVGFRSGGFRIRRRLLRVLCEKVAVGFPNGGSGKLVGGSRECRVGI